MRRLAPLFLAALLLAACSSGGDDRRALQDSATTVVPIPPTLSTTTTTTAPPPVTTTTVAPPPGPQPLAGLAARAVMSPSGVVVPVQGPDPDGLRVGTPCGRTVVLANGTPIGAATVVLDAGHGGIEPGATGPNGLTENVLNLAVVRHAQAALEQAGVSVAVTRNGNYRMTLEARAAIVKALQPKAFVSVHHNAEPDEPRSGPGSEMYYQVDSPESKRLSGLLYEEVVKALSQYQVAWVADRDAGTKYRKNAKGGDYYGILRQTAGIPSSLAELGFISNPPEAELYARPEVQQVEGAAVARGIVRFLTTQDPGSGYVEPYPRETPAGPGGGSSGCVDPPL